MAWSLVGSTSAIITAGAGNQTVTLPGTVASGDLVLVATAADVSCQNVVATAGYTAPENTTGANPGANFSYKVITSDTSVDIVRNATILRAVVVQVWRGGMATILDAAYTTAVTGTSANPNSGAITTVSVDALIVTIAYLDDDDSTVSVVPSTFNNLIEGNTGQASTTVGATVAMASVIQGVAGALDPSAWTLSSSDAWSASSIAFAVAEFGPSLLTESVEVTDGPPTGSGLEPAALSTGLLTEHLKIDDIGQGATQLVGQIKIQDVVTASLDHLEAGPGESVRVTDTTSQTLSPLETSAQEAIKVVDDRPPSATLVMEGGDLTTGLLTETLKVSDTSSQTLAPLETAPQESVRVTDSRSATLDPLQAGPSEAVKVSDTTSTLLFPLGVSLTESIRVIDGNEAWAEMSQTELIRVSDQVTATLTPLEASAQEILKVRDTLTVDPFGLVVELTESVKVADVLTITETPLQAGPSESLRVTDSLAITETPLQATPQETVKATDTVTSEIALADVSKTETITVSESLSLTLNPEQAQTSEAIRLSDQVSAQLALLLASVQEAVKVSDAAAAGFDLARAVTDDTIRITDTVTAQLATLLPTPANESVKVSDSAQGTLVDQGALSATLNESLKVQDILQGSIDSLQVVLTESVRVTESTFGIVGAGALLQEGLEVTDTITAALDHLEATPSESIRVADVVDLNPAVADYVIRVRPRTTGIHVRVRVTTIRVKP